MTYDDYYKKTGGWVPLHNTAHLSRVRLPLASSAAPRPPVAPVPASSATGNFAGQSRRWELPDPSHSEAARVVHRTQQHQHQQQQQHQQQHQHEKRVNMPCHSRRGSAMRWTPRRRRETNWTMAPWADDTCCWRQRFTRGTFTPGIPVANTEPATTRPPDRCGVRGTKAALPLC